MDRRRVVGAILAVAGAATIGTWVLAPGRVRTLLDSARMATSSLPGPVVLGTLGLVVVGIWLVGMWVTARLWYRVWRWLWPRYKRVAGIVLPDSPLVQFATGVMLLIGLVILLVAALPSLVGDIGASTEDVTNVSENLAGQGVTRQGLTSDWGQNLSSDGNEQPRADDDGVEGPDTDCDGLPDRWEEAGETPSGVPLPDADPNHKDLYMQVNHGEGVDPLTARERTQLREIWADMPVENPDNETGIDVHIRTNGSVGETAVFDDTDEYDRYYTEQYLGNRTEVYHQVVYGQLELGNTVGYASVPGYASIVEGRQVEDYDTRDSPRVGVTTHELLHNVAGRVDGQLHTSEGWLTSSTTDEYLSPRTARHLNQTGLYGPVH